MTLFSFSFSFFFSTENGGLGTENVDAEASLVYLCSVLSTDTAKERTDVLASQLIQMCLKSFGLTIK